MIKTLLALATPLAMLTAPAVTALETEVAAAATIAMPLMGQSSYYWSGDVSGTNTIDYTYDFYLTDFDRYDFEFTAAGNGSNTLTVKIQVKLLDGTWSNVVVRKLTPGQTKRGEFQVANNTPGNECYRVRMSRKLGTRRIDYTVRLTRK
ncbi:MAG: hypothetical protein KDC98_10970 [Planctomycetes bacterium]|nr:hypothetical protein [Planctomycetota bacterium]